MMVALGLVQGCTKPADSIMSDEDFMAHYRQTYPTNYAVYLAAQDFSNELHGKTALRIKPELPDIRAFYDTCPEKLTVDIGYRGPLDQAPFDGERKPVFMVHCIIEGQGMEDKVLWSAKVHSVPPRYPSRP